MNPLAILASATLLATATLARTQQTSTFTDPANLRDERVRPTDGRELPVDQGARGLEQMLRRLNTRASILNIVAHPDDEDGGMLALYSRGLGARVADLSLTRGEGGQNAVTGDFEDALGLLRTQELLSSDRYPGINQFFGTEVDFGFSKTKEEAFGKWTHERVLYDVVRAIRLYRPLVLTSTWIGGVTDGHGHHQVSGQITQEAFNAAGDPNVFPELTREGILPWQPLKVYARVPQQAITPKGLFDYATGQYTPARFTNYVTGEVSSTPPSADIIVHEGTPDPLLTPAAANHADLPSALARADADPHRPLSYVQFSRIGLGLQKSQIGPGVRDAPTSAFDVAYHLYGSRISGKPHKADEANFFDGIDTSLMSIADLDPKAFPPNVLSDISQAVGAATHQFKPSQPDAIAPLLAVALKKVDFLISSVSSAKGDTPTEKASALHELHIKRVQLNQALTLALGLSLKADALASNVPTRTPVEAEVYLTKLSDSSVLITRTSTQPADVRATLQHKKEPLRWTDTTSTNGSPLHTFQAPCHLLSTDTVTRPYFFRENFEQPFYNLSDPALRTAPVTPPALICAVELNYNGVPLTLAAVASHEGQALSLVPQGSISTFSHAQVFPDRDPDLLVALSVTPPETRVEGELPNGWKVTPDIEPKDSPSGLKQLRLTPPPGARSSLDFRLIAVPKQGPEFTESYRAVGYPGLPKTNFYTPAIIRIVPVDLKLPSGVRLAYLPGTGDAVASALASVGVQSTEITVADLTPEKLSQFDTVLLGVRAYAAHPDLHGARTQALLDFARNGGNVVLQYQSAEFTAADAPYPLTLGRDAEKVVDEAAGVQLLDPASPLLSAPNRITIADFGGWIEERGHGFLRTWDSHYTALTETHDPGQDPQRGGLVTVQLGNGRWTYLAYALYRQMPEAVPGSFRLMLNLIAPTTVPK